MEAINKRQPYTAGDLRRDVRTALDHLDGEKLADFFALATSHRLSMEAFVIYLATEKLLGLKRAERYKRRCIRVRQKRAKRDKQRRGPGVL